MVKFEFFPTVSIVTLFTVRTIAALVDIIQLMAGIAFHWCFQIMLTCVAAAAIGFFMCPDQWEIRFIVIIMNITPVLFVVATAALVKHLTHGCSLVWTFLFVAAITGMGRLGVFLAGLVAGVTTGFAMLPA